MIIKENKSIFITIQSIALIVLFSVILTGSGKGKEIPPLLRVFRCTGLVTDKGNNHIEHAYISLYTRHFRNQSWELKSSVYTDEDGSYCIGYTGTSPEDIFAETDFRITVRFGPDIKVTIIYDWGFHSWDISLDPAKRWWKITCTSPSSVLSMLNNGYWGRSLTQAKIAAEWKNSSMYFEVYNILGQPADTGGDWTYVHYNSPEDVLNFLNGVSPEDDPVDRPMICALYDNDVLDFYVFFRKRNPDIQWDMRSYGTYQAVLNWINGDPLYRYRRKPIGSVEICSVSIPDSKYENYYYVFGQTATSRQLRDIWAVQEFTSSSGILDILNNPGQLIRPVLDGKRIALSGSGKYSVLMPQGLVVITRPMFKDSFDDYALWKLKHGFETTIVTAEWIQNTFTGVDLRHKIRNCLREYYYSRGARFAMLVGDSTDGENTDGFPPETSLDDPWNLPAGYYTREQNDYPKYTCAFFADLTDKEYYYEYENLFKGDFAIKVGVVPVRTGSELNNVLNKFMTYNPGMKLHSISSYDMVTDYYYQYLSRLEDVIAEYSLNYNYNYAFDSRIFEANSSQYEVIDSVFKNPGILDICVHGNLYEILPGDVHISFMDAYRFQYVNPLYISGSCGINNYMKGRSLCEEFLKAAKGPAVIALPPLSSHTNLWNTLFQGYSIGEAFYNEVDGAPPSYWQLFGDPSLVMIDLNW